MNATRALGVHTRLLARTFAAAGPQPTRSMLRLAAASRASTSAPTSTVTPARASSSSASSVAGKTIAYTQDQSLELLNKQRSLRPTSPHLTIYQPQLTWLGSIANRVTGVGLSAALYAWALAYLAGPYLGLETALSSAYLTEFVSHMPFWLKATVKAPFAAAISYHTLNGFRHLAWDWGYLLSLRGAYTSGYVVIAASIASTVGLVLL